MGGKGQNTKAVAILPPMDSQKKSDRQNGWAARIKAPKPSPSCPWSTTSGDKVLLLFSYLF
jgi:hypothetical protein